MEASVIIQQMTIIFLLLAIGFVAVKLKVTEASAGKQISRIVLYVCSPTLMVLSASKADKSLSKGLMLQAVAVCLIMYLFLVISAEILPALIFSPKHEKSFYRMMTVFTNVGFIGIPVVNAVLGPDGVLLTIVFNIGYNLLFYTYGFMLMKRQASPGEKMQIPWKDIVNIGTISSVIAILIYVLDIRLPELVIQTADYTGSSTTFLSMFVIGMNLGQSSIKKVFGDKRLYLFLVLRQILIPFAFGMLLKPFIRNELLFAVSLIMASMPVGSMPMMLAQEQGLDSTLLANGVIVGTVLSVITIPLVLIMV